MNKPLTISLVIPVWNEEDQIADCLRSVMSQRRQFDEIIVVDNNSTDNTVAIAAEFAGVVILRESRQGIVFARDRGFDAATSQIIARIDADSRLPVNWSQRVIDFYSDDQHTSTAWTASAIFTDVAVSRLVSAGYQLVTVHINRWLTGYPALWGSSTALPAQSWKKIRRHVCRVNGIHEDLDLTIHLQQAGQRIFWDKSIKVSAQLRHAKVANRQLWNYLQWWPRTLRKHQLITWPICWLGGTLLMFIATWSFMRLTRFYNRVTQRLAAVSTSLDV